MSARCHQTHAPSKTYDVTFLFQGGGALAAYQAGVYQAFEEANILPNWICGISMGAINSAIIAGNPPAQRLAKLRAFWEEMSQNSVPNIWGRIGDQSRHYFNQLSSQKALWCGVHHFYKPRWPGPLLSPAGTMEALSFYDTRPMFDTLARYIDFDRINNNPEKLRLTVGATNVERGDSTFFDTQKHTIGPEHIMASAALPPAFPPIKVDDGYYWDGGVVSNTPLQWIFLDKHALPKKKADNMLIVQVDLWSRSGNMPRTIFDVFTRQKEIQYTSRTRIMTNQFKHMGELNCLITNLLNQLSPKNKDLARLRKMAKELLPSTYAYNLVHLIYRSRNHELHSKDYNFSKLSIQERWDRGFEDAKVALHHKELLKFPNNPHGFNVLDFQKDSNERG